jgi:hypothetical protein
MQLRLRTIGNCLWPANYRSGILLFTISRFLDDRFSSHNLKSHSLLSYLSYSRWKIFPLEAKCVRPHSDGEDDQLQLLQ